MTKGKPQGGVGGQVASSTMAYPGNCFKYSPKLPTDEPQKKLRFFDAATTVQQSKVSSGNSPLSSNRKADASLFPDTKIKPHTEQSKDDSAEQSRLLLHKSDEINLIPEEKPLISAEQYQKQLEVKKVIVKVMKEAEKQDAHESGLSCKEHTKKVKNGPKKYKN